MRLFNTPKIKLSKGLDAVKAEINKHTISDINQFKPVKTIKQPANNENNE